MYTEEERAKWRKMFKEWKETGESPWNAGKRVEKTDATTVQRQEPVLPIKRDFITEAQRKHAAEAVGPDTRSSYLRKQAQAAKLYANLQYQKAKDDAKREEGFSNLMKMTSPSTYAEAITGKDFGTVGRLATDAAVFGLPGLLKYGAVKATTSPILLNANRIVVKGSGPYYAKENLKKYIAQETLISSVKDNIDSFTGKPIFLLYKGIYDMPVSEEIKQIYNNSILPRLLFMRPGYHGGIMRPTVKSHIDDALERGYTVYPELVFKDAGEPVNVAGLHFLSTGHIAIKEGKLNFSIGHELRHRLDRSLKLTDDELDILLDAYDPSFSVLNQTDEDLKHVANMNTEMVTTNFDARKKLLGDYHLKNTPVNLQNKIIDKSTDQQIFDALENANGYGYAYTKQLKKDGKLTPEFANSMRKALKYVGAFSMPTTFTYNMYK